MHHELCYVAIGDSLTVGVGAPMNRGFASRYHRLLEQSLDKHIHFINAGVSGATSQDVLELITLDSSMQEELKEADIITITVGGNDLLRAAEVYFTDQEIKHMINALKNFKHNMREIITTIKELKNDELDDCMIHMTNLYNPKPQMLDAQFVVNRFNNMIQRFNKGNIRVANAYQAYIGYEEQYLFSDQVHPNSKGYEVLADSFHHLGYEPLKRKM
ncbi:GDSL-type esterase/lipase family protein [Chengkuizengella axinellae]|uniref:GDSL-type esterase/lipase family protein n=1 Tax=Chengkuizengella axinellae TaxID=3064388 RepID=A0ABT9J516_9BACL|nr:GDSL-type esterase/lipase family protein [Chengkuizengella sp. 2205SS18-9]MDP5276698.1 GDSL-type esterase/lipase family protein [Chengkuizengella sp. 2205SS18-9]